MSIPLVFAMVSQHATWAAGGTPGTYGVSDAFLPAVILVAWAVAYLLFQKAKKVPGF
jgi:hypothetical protein